MRPLVAICTFNPNIEVLAETLRALRNQTMPSDQWDLLIVDNASTNGFHNQASIDWHPSAKIVSEPTPGVFHARKRAIHVAQEQGNPLVLFVDDDNRLNADYICNGLLIHSNDKRLGCWGGQLIADYAKPPPPWFAPFEKYIAVYAFDQEIVSNSFSGNYDIFPPTAGMFIHTSIALAYYEAISGDPLRRVLGSMSTIQIRGEDTDMALYVLDKGFTIGRFPTLRLRHFIPENRTTLDYLQKTIHGIAAAITIIEYLRGKPLTKNKLSKRVLNLWRRIRLPEPHKSIFSAELDGVQTARRIIHSLSHERN